MSSALHRPLLVSIVGPTAIGKTALSISLAQQYKTHVISADSRQMYGQIPIGTAAPSMEEQAGVPHHFVGQLDLQEDYSAGRFEREVLALIQGELNHLDVIILCGGSGLFVKAVLDGLDEVPKDAAIRESLNERLAKEGIESLLQELESLDPVTMTRIDQQNPQRVVRALEVCLSSGKPYSSYLNPAPKPRPFDTLTIGLRTERELLRSRIALRCEQMLASGWIEEASAVQELRELNALKTIGYRQLFEYLDGKIDLATCQDSIITETQQFAKRQMTWFKRLSELHWMDTPDGDIVKKSIELVDFSVHR